jgi:hypothetical protein
MTYHVLIIVVPTAVIMVAGYFILGPPGHRHQLTWPRRLLFIVILTAVAMVTIYLIKHR